LGPEGVQQLANIATLMKIEYKSYVEILGDKRCTSQFREAMIYFNGGLIDDMLEFCIDQAIRRSFSVQRSNALFLRSFLSLFARVLC